MAGPFYNLAAFQTGRAVASLLPRAWAHRLAEQLGQIGYQRNAGAREAIHANLAHITGSNGTDLDLLCAANVRNFSRMMAD
jgi:lauroyl/myristoyl acyltransferase